MLYKILFSDLTTFNGGDNLYQTRWKDINKRIGSIEYYFKNKRVKLTGFEAYNHLVEGHKDLSHKTYLLSKLLKKGWFFNPEVEIDKTYLMGKTMNKITIFTFDYRKGTIAVRIIPCNQDKTVGWKPGINSRKPSIEMF